MKHFNGSNVFWSADLHLFHQMLLKYRPFQSVDEMHEQIGIRWNKKVGKNDPVFILGDLSFASPKRTIPILEQLNGIKHLIKGNHDHSKELKHYWPYITSVEPCAEIKVMGQHIVMSHFPYLVWNMHHHGSWMLHGHSHGNLNWMNETVKRLDVGIDNFDYAPVSFDEVKAIMDNRGIVALDHHKEDGVQEVKVKPDLITLKAIRALKEGR